MHAGVMAKIDVVRGGQDRRRHPLDRRPADSSADDDVVPGCPAVILAQTTVASRETKQGAWTVWHFLTSSRDVPEPRCPS
jgi:hypothetical protein